ncbi:Homeobox protein Mohawk [Myotis brandtii]|uniref:Homeobox protein Mohawk n=1 Tax=Myotis brandtii TaxID=109478 RepID=S7PT72_MYOBR|nr:Homeobox protein Mohawk [Myotis brandtii]
MTAIDALPWSGAHTHLLHHPAAANTHHVPRTPPGDTLENGSNKSAANRKGLSKDDTYWKEINAAMALTNLAQGKDRLQGTASCIIQKSSHIAEVKTVKVPLAQQF